MFIDQYRHDDFNILGGQEEALSEGQAFLVAVQQEFYLAEGHEDIGDLLVESLELREDESVLDALLQAGDHLQDVGFVLLVDDLDLLPQLLNHCHLALALDPDFLRDVEFLPGRFQLNLEGLLADHASEDALLSEHEVDMCTGQTIFVEDLL